MESFFDYIKCSSIPLPACQGVLPVTFSIWLARSNRMFDSWELVERPEVPTVMQLEREGPWGQST